MLNFNQNSNLAAKISLFLVVLYFQSFNALGQVTGDYRSIATGNWSATSTWQYFNGSAWIAASNYPSQSNGDQTVTIQSPNVVTWNLPSMPFQIVNLTVNSGATLQDLPGAFNYIFAPSNLITVSGTMTMSNTSDPTSLILAGNMNVQVTGVFSARRISIVTTNNRGTSTITDGLGGVLWRNQANSILNFGGATMSASLLASFVNNTVNYNSSTINQTIAAPGDSYYNLTISGTGGMTKTLSANTTALGTVSIQNNSLFNLFGFNLSVGVNWNNSSSAGLFSFSSTVTFNGSVQQNIINTGNLSGTFFYNLIFNNSSATSPQIIVNDPVYVWSALTMLKGNIDLQGHLIELGSNYASTTTINHSGLSSAGWFYNGFFARILQDGSTIADGSTNSLFPVGTSTEFRPMYLSCPVVAPVSATIFVQCNAATNTTIVNIPDTGGPIVRQYQGYWQMFTSASAGTFNLNAGGTGFGVVANVNDLRLSLAASVTGNAGSNSGTTSFPMVQRTGLTAADLTNNFYMSSVEPVGSYLPVQLVSFNGKANGDAINLEWHTQSELNSLRFNLLRSTNGFDFMTIGSVDGQGTTNKAHDYSLIDYNPAKGKSYYRLEQLGEDLKSNVLKTIVVEINSVSPLKIYPNPIAEGEAVNLDINGFEPYALKEIHIADLKGNLMASQTITTDENGNFSGQISTQHLTSGLYIVNLESLRMRIYVK